MSNYRYPTYFEALDMIEELEAKLAESEKSNEYFADRVEKADKEIKENYRNYNKLVEEYNELKQQLAEKEKELENITESSRVVILSHIEFTENINKNKISFAVEQLEKVLKILEEKQFYKKEDTAYCVHPAQIAEYIYDQIKQLKEGE